MDEQITITLHEVAKKGLEIYTARLRKDCEDEEMTEQEAIQHLVNVSMESVVKDEYTRIQREKTTQQMAQEI